MPGTVPQTYDLTTADYAFSPVDDGQRGHVSCWNGLAPQPGDYLILRNGTGSARYQVTASDPCFGVDPPTMWMADLVFAPRPVCEEQADGKRRKLRRFHWWDGALWWYSYAGGGFEGYRTAGGRRLACATMETAINRPDMADEIRRIAARRR